MNIYQLSAEYQRIMNIIEETDEINDELMQALIQVNDDIESKVLNYASMIKSLEAKANAIEEAMVSMAKRRTRILASVNRLKETVKTEMQKCEKKKIENEYHVAKLVQNNPKVQFSDKNLIPEGYWRKHIKEIVEPNTLLISKALKENIEVPGAFLVQEQRLEIR